MPDWSVDTTTGYRMPDWSVDTTFPTSLNQYDSGRLMRTKEPLGGPTWGFSSFLAFLAAAGSFLAAGLAAAAFGAAAAFSAAGSFLAASARHTGRLRPTDTRRAPEPTPRAATAAATAADPAGRRAA